MLSHRSTMAGITVTWGTADTAGGLRGRDSGSSGQRGRCGLGLLLGEGAALARWDDEQSGRERVGQRQRPCW